MKKKYFIHKLIEESGIWQKRRPEFGPGVSRRRSSACEYTGAMQAGLYHTRSQTWNLDRAKAPGSNDRKRVHISNIDPFTIVESRELSRWPKSIFQADRSITNENMKSIKKIKALEKLR